VIFTEEAQFLNFEGKCGNFSHLGIVIICPIGQD